MHQGAGRWEKRSPPHILADEHFIRLQPLDLRWGFETTSIKREAGIINFQKEQEYFYLWPIVNRVE